MTGGTYQRGPIVYDVPESTLVGVVRVIRPAVELIPGVSFSPLGVYGGVLLTLISGPSPESWVLLDPVTGEESERHAANAFGDALLDQIVASVWIAEYPDKGSLGYGNKTRPSVFIGVLTALGLRPGGLVPLQPSG